jgi:hypothetical protein
VSALVSTKAEWQGDDLQGTLVSAEAARKIQDLLS